jgi:twinfilin-like protein
MLYASTRSSLTRTLGASSFVDSAFISSSSDLVPTLSSRSATGPTTGGPARAAVSPGLVPLSSRETELAQIAHSEAVERARDTAPKTHHSRSAMPFDPAVDGALGQLKAGEVNVVVIGIKTTKESDTIVLKSTASVGEGEGLAGVLPKGEPSYVFYAHAAGGKTAYRTHLDRNLGQCYASMLIRDTVFIYACPDSSSIKEKMVYSTSRWNIIHKAEDEQIKLERKIETSDISELTAAHLLSELYPNGPPSSASGTPGADTPAPTVSAQQGFARPTRPGRRAAP